MLHPFVSFFRSYDQYTSKAQVVGKLRMFGVCVRSNFIANCAKYNMLTDTQLIYLESKAVASKDNVKFLHWIKLLKTIQVLTFVRRTHVQKSQIYLSPTNNRFAIMGYHG